MAVGWEPLPGGKWAVGRKCTDGCEGGVPQRGVRQRRRKVQQSAAATAAHTARSGGCSVQGAPPAQRCLHLQRAPRLTPAARSLAARSLAPVQAHSPLAPVTTMARTSLRRWTSWRWVNTSRISAAQGAEGRARLSKCGIRDACRSTAPDRAPSGCSAFTGGLTRVMTATGPSTLSRAPGLVRLMTPRWWSSAAGPWRVARQQ